MDTSDIIPKDSIEFIQIRLPSAKQSKLLDGVFDMSKSERNIFWKLVISTTLIKHYFN